MNDKSVELQLEDFQAFLETLLNCDPGDEDEEDDEEECPVPACK